MITTDPIGVGDRVAQVAPSTRKNPRVSIESLPTKGKSLSTSSYLSVTNPKFFLLLVNLSSKVVSFPQRFLRHARYVVLQPYLRFSFLILVNVQLVQLVQLADGCRYASINSSKFTPSLKSRFASAIQSRSDISNAGSRYFNPRLGFPAATNRAFNMCARVSNLCSADPRELYTRQ